MRRLRSALVVNGSVKVRFRFATQFGIQTVKPSQLWSTGSQLGQRSVNRRPGCYIMHASESCLGNDITKSYLASFAQGNSEFMARLE
ncbi:hypothetical protein Hdeb2414_s0010g00350641 [Helianthus debilis subsp. tardiflorus]